MPRRLPLVCVVVAVSLACSSAASCSTREGAEPPKRSQPKNSADLCQTLGRESLDRLVPDGEPEAEADDFGKFRCRSGVYIRVLYQADQADRDEVAGDAENLAREYLDTLPR